MGFIMIMGLATRILLLQRNAPEIPNFPRKLRKQLEACFNELRKAKQQRLSQTFLSTSHLPTELNHLMVSYTEDKTPTSFTIPSRLDRAFMLPMAFVTTLITFATLL